MFDMRFSTRTDRHYFIPTGPDTLGVSDEREHQENLSLPTTNGPHYRDFVFDALGRVKEGKGPLADMTDMAEVLRLVEAAYTLAGWSGTK